MGTRQVFSRQGWVNRALPVAIALSLLAACGEKRSAQCEKIGAIVNRTGSQKLSASGTTESFPRGAALSTQAADELMALELGDKKLSNLRSHLAAAYRDSAAASLAMDSITGAEGTVIIDKDTSPEHLQITEQFNQAGQAFNSVVNATQTYCNGGEVPSELTDGPAAES